ncbi:hypothetical protein BDQ12DRAFT_500578 [Crucibulum laeve]|uniref:Uncharacterized protein n=1 Tax=Crucibulum laeve TaxID=68775 RepID=A0A5C3LJT0_9AGAR|nr:hypothetical protein BDQ12DRAFT_500578 [Crucibulum laeve]
MYRLWYIKLRPAQRRLVFLVFSTSLLTLVAVGAVAVVSYGKVVKGPEASLVWLMTMNIEEAISVIACNLPVLVFWGYRTFLSDDDDPSGDHITPHWSRVAPGGVSTPAFSLSALSSGRSQISDNIVQIPASDASFYHSDQNARRGSDNFEVWKATEDVPDAMSQKDNIL